MYELRVQNVKINCTICTAAMLVFRGIARIFAGDVILRFCLLKGSGLDGVKPQKIFLYFHHLDGILYSEFLCIMLLTAAC